MKIYATGIFPDPELSEYWRQSIGLNWDETDCFFFVCVLLLLVDRMVLDFVNQYWQFFYREMLPESKKRMEPILLAEANKFLSYVPIRKILYYAEEPIESKVEA